MVWTTLDDAAPKSPKAQKAGNEAWSLWVGAIIYCNRHLTDGFVPLAALATECLPEPISLAKARKLATTLMEANIRADGKGLFEPASGGYFVHDFLDWNDSKAVVEERRKNDRNRKRGRTGIPSGVPPDSGRNSGEIPDGKRKDSGPPRASPSQPNQPVRTGPAGGSLPPRPVLPPELLPAKHSASSWLIPPPLLQYAVDLGLSANERESAIADFREKITRQGHAAWLSDKLCRFFEAVAERARAEGKAPTKSDLIPLVTDDHVDDWKREADRRYSGGAQ